MLGQIVKPYRGMQLNKTHPLARGLLAGWLMNEGAGSRVYDITGNGHTGTLTNMDQTNWIPGKYGHSLDFISGSSTYVSVAVSNALRDLPTTYDFTVIIWFNADAVNNNSMFAWFGTDDLVIYPNSPNPVTGDIRIYWRNLGADLLRVGGADLSGEWHQCVLLSRASNDHEYYRDGISIVTSSNTGTAGPFTGMNIGTFESGNQHWDGVVDHIMVYQRALTNAEILRLYREPFAMFQQESRVQLFSVGAPPVGNAPTGAIYGPLYGPMGGPV